MKKLIILVIFIISVPSNALAALILDQVNEPTTAGFAGDAAWQQEIIAGMDGVLAQVDVFLYGSGSMYMGINLGSPAQTDADDFSTIITTDGSNVYTIDLLNENIELNAGDIFSLRLGDEASLWPIAGTSSSPGSGYAGDLYLNGNLFTSSDGLEHDLGFRTYMAAKPIPEPSSFALMLIGFGGLTLYRKKQNR